MGKQEILRILSAYDVELAKFRQEYGDPDSDEQKQIDAHYLQLLEGFGSIAEARRAAQYQEEEPSGEMAKVDDWGGKLRQFGQGVTLGFGDEIVGAIKSVSPNITYGEARDKSRAGIEQFRRDNPLEAMGWEAAGSIVPGLLTAGAGTAATGMNLARLAGSTSRGARALGMAIPAAAGGAVYGAGEGEGSIGNRASEALKTGLIAGGTGGVLGASPVGTFIGKGIRKRGGAGAALAPLTRGQPGSILRHAPENINIPFKQKPVPVQRPLREIFEARIQPGTYGEEAAEVLGVHSGRATARNLVPEETLQRGGRELEELLPENELIPFTGAGSEFWNSSKIAKNIGLMLQRIKTQKTILTAAKEIDRKEVYSPLDAVFTSGWNVNRKLGQTFDKKVLGDWNNTLSRIAKFAGKSADDATWKVKYEAGVDAGLKDLKGIVKIIKKDAGHLLSPRGQTQTFGLDNKGATRLVTELVADLEAGRAPSLHSMQIFRNTLRELADRGDQKAVQFVTRIESIMDDIYPGLKGADDIFRQGSARLDAYNYGLNRTNKISFKESPVQASKLKIGGKPSDLSEAVEFVESQGGSVAESRILRNNFLDSLWQSEIESPLLIGREGGEEAAEAIYDLLGSSAGRGWVRQFFAKGAEGDQAYAAAIRHLDDILPLRIRQPIVFGQNMAEWAKRLKQVAGFSIAAALVGGVAKMTGLLGGGGSGGPERFD
tara:strand:+ start:1611 stop:3758 length:2148 start_codon:yes stop_codon:yes gene_type:complete